MTDSELICPENLYLFCKTNGHLISGAPVGIVVEFPGLGGGSCIGGSEDFGPYETPLARELAKNSVLMVYTFPGPWNWMNKGAVRYCDLILDAAFKKYGIAEDAPIVTAGGSMGGHSSMLFAMESRHKIAACVAACPNFDVWGELFKKQHRPRAILAAVASYDMPLEDAVKSISVTEQMSRLPEIPYYIVGDEYDECFDIADTNAFVEKLKARGLNVDYRFVAKGVHGAFDESSRRDMVRFMLRNAKP